MENTNLILELWGRIQKLEAEVENLKKAISRPTNTSPQPMPAEKNNEYGTKDTTKYVFDGNIYGKNRLVLAVVKAYVKANPTITCSTLKKTFPDELQGSIGVVSEDPRYYSDPEKRFFMRAGEELNLTDGTMYVCTQWAIVNIKKFIDTATTLGFTITPQ